jgi:hypothetical protein
MNLTLDDLKTEWMARDRQLETELRMNTLLLRETLLQKHSAALGNATGGNVVQILFTIPFLAFFGWFITRHIDEPAFLLPAVLLQVWTVVMLALSIHQRSQLRGLDYGRPVLELQSQIEQIKIARLNTFKWAFLTGQLMWWIPFVLVLFKGLLGVNLYTVSAFMPQFIAWNIAFGVAFVPFALWASKLLAGRLGRSPRFQRFTDGIAGRDVVVAREFLGKLARFGLEVEGR